MITLPSPHLGCLFVHAANCLRSGLYHVVETMEGIEPYTLAILTRVLGQSQDEAMKVVDAVKKEIANSKNLLLSKHRFVYGRKPT